MTFEESLKDKLQRGFDPEYLEVINDSSHHHGHAGSPNTGDSHFTIKMRAHAFAGKSKVACHRLIYALLDEELKTTIHALKLELSAT